MQMKARVSPQPGQSIPSNRRLEQLSGRALVKPGRKTACLPSVLIRTESKMMMEAKDKKIR
jgi:hypothetical protein